MFETGILLLFLVPGLAAYAAIYGLFHNGKAIAPEPPSANTIEAVVVIVGASLLIHLATALAFAANRIVCAHSCLVTVPSAWFDPYASALDAVEGKGIGGTALALALAGVLTQGAAAYAGIRWRLGYLARRDRLPIWIYGWAAPLANAADNADTVILGYVLTDLDVGGRPVSYGGAVHDIALKPDGCMTRITLTSCERYLVDLNAMLDEPSLSAALSRFPFMVLEAARIRNIAFEMIILPPEPSSSSAR